MPNYNPAIDRTGASALIPTEYASQIIKATVQQSAALQLCRRATMSSGQQRMPVLSVLPESYWVSDDSGLKQTTSAAWEGVFLNSEELASITPIPEAVLDDASFDVWGEVQEAVGQSIAAKIDAAVFSGVEKPATWPQALISGATAAGNVITPRRRGAFTGTAFAAQPDSARPRSTSLHGTFTAGTRSTSSSSRRTSLLCISATKMAVGSCASSTGTPTRRWRASASARRSGRSRR